MSGSLDMTVRVWDLVIGSDGLAVLVDRLNDITSMIARLSFDFKFYTS